MNRPPPEPSAAEAGDFEDFYQRHYHSLVGLAYALTGSRSASEELAQESLLAAYRRWSTVGSYDSPGAWVRRVLINRCRSRHRRALAEVRAMTKILNRPERLAELPEPDHEFWAAVRALPERQAQVVALHYLEDRPVDDIANILDCAPGTIKTHLHRARGALESALALADSHAPAADQEARS